MTITDSAVPAPPTPPRRGRPRLIGLVALLATGVLALGGLTVSQAVQNIADGDTAEFGLSGSFRTLAFFVPVGETATSGVFIDNTGTAPLVISDARASGRSDPSEFRVVPDFGECSRPVQPGQGCFLRIEFQPTAAGLREGTLTVFGNTPDGQRTIRLFGSAGAGEAAWNITPGPSSFGEHPVGSSTVRTFTFTNEGTVTAWVAGVRALAPGGDAPAFPVVGSTCQDVYVEPGRSCTFDVAFRPTTSGYQSAQLVADGVIGSSASEGRDFRISGFGGPGTTSRNELTVPATVSVPPTGVDVARLVDIPLTNSGTTPVQTSVPAATGPFEARGCATIQPGTTCRLQVVFTPTALGPVRGSVTFRDDTPQGVHTIELNGEGVDPGPTPVVTSFTPDSGLGRAETPVTASGENLPAVTRVTGFDDLEIPFSHNPDGTIAFRMPSTNFYGDYSVTFYTATGVNVTTPFHVLPAPPPVITRLTPNRVPTTGGTQVRLVGTDLDLTSLIIDDAIPIDLRQVTISPDRRTATFRTPALTEETHWLRARTTTGETGAELTAYVAAPPTITGTTPGNGPAKGNTAVRLTGTDLAGATVSVDGAQVAATVNAAGTSLSFRTPQHAPGSVPVVITAPGGSAQTSFTYDPIPAPTVAGIAPSSGPAKGGTTARLTGTDLAGASVTVGGQAVAPTVNAAGTSLSFRTPAHASGPVPVVVTTANGTAQTTFTYDPIPAPTVTAITPTTGPARGGTTVRLTGTNLDGATVTIGGQQAAATVNAAGTSLTFRTPAHAAGPVQVTVTTPGGTSTGQAYTYR